MPWNRRRINALRRIGAVGTIVLGAGTACTLFILATTHSRANAAPAPTPAPASAPSFHDRVVAEYLEGKWSDLETDLGPPTAKPPAGLAASERADVDAIRRALGEGRPTWWKQTALGKKVAFRPMVWGRTLAATYDPAAKSSISISFSGGQPSVTVMWDASEMDNPAHAEHGFSKGELNDLDIWINLGMAESWTALPLQSQVNLNDQARLLLTRYLEFRGNVTGTYYGSPRARRWGLWLGLAAYMEKYAKSPAVMSRKAVGAMFVAEVVGHPARYPSIKLPDKLPDEGVEAKLADHLKGWVEKHGLTLAEDEALREAIKTFAAANGANVRQSGKVTLPNKTEVALDPEADKASLAKREEWLKAQIKGSGK